MRTAVYTGTRNLYYYMVAAAKSLLAHSNVEKIYFLIEDDTFPYELPPKTSTINVSGQTFFDPDGPNFRSQFTYMALIRVALGKILSEDIVLSLDVDTIVNENISKLWELDISNYYLAAARQPRNCTETFLDINCGVMLLNLKKLREDKKDDELIAYINSTYEKLPEQNALNKLCQGYILEIPADYNMNDSTDFESARSRKISHFAGVQNWQRYPIFKKYFEAPVQFNLPDASGLDIIIPSYNDEKGLIRTLKSIYYHEMLSWIHIIVIDDASNVDYTKIVQDFPMIQLIRLPKNAGPGHARYIGMKNTHSPYLMFLDCGDVILSKYCFFAIQNQLDNHRVFDIFEWSWIDSATRLVSEPNETSTPGKIYRREFLEAYGIYPYHSGPGSYAAEDCGFNLSCYSIIEDYKYEEYTEHMVHFDLPIYKTVVNNNSLTYKDNKEFLYTALPGLVENGIQCVRNCERTQVHVEITLKQLNLFFVDIYTYFLRCVARRPELLQSHWTWMRKYYFEVYKKYENMEQNDTELGLAFKPRLKHLIQYIPTPNVKRLLRELATNETVPNYYYNFFID